MHDACLDPDHDSHKTVSNKELIWAPKPKMGSKRPKISLQQSTYAEDLFWVA